MSLEDPSEEVIKLYLKKCLEQFDEVSEEQKNILICKHIQALGTRFLDAHRLRFHSADCKSLTEVEEVCDKLIADTTEAYSRSVKTFAKKFNSKRILNMLLENKLKLHDICSEFRVTEKEFLNFVTELNPQPVYVNPISYHVSVGNTVAKRELKKTVQGMWW